VAQVRFGIKTGANEFFYLTEEEIERRGIEREFWMHQDDHSNWGPNYVIKSPRECKSIAVRPEELRYRVLMIHKDREELQGTNVLRYIEEGERKGFHQRPTCASRERWYDLGQQRPADGIWFKAFNDRFLAPRNLVESFSSDRFYAIYLKNKAASSRLFFYLNSTLPALIAEIFGRVNLGEGALDNMTYEAASMPVLDVVGQQATLDGVCHSLECRPVGSIFDELGADTPAEVSLDKVKPDRRELDRIIMGEILGLSEAEQLEVYRAVVDLVGARLARARSLANQRQGQGGADVDEIKGSVVRRIRESGP